MDSISKNMEIINILVFRRKDLDKLKDISIKKNIKKMKFYFIKVMSQNIFIF